MNIRNWLKPLAIVVVALGLAVPAVAAVYERSGLIVPPGSHVKLGDNSALRFGDGASGADPTVFDISARWDGTDLDVLLNADDTVVRVGNGSQSGDLWWYGDTSADYLLIDASANQISTQGDMYLLLNDARCNLVAKTANYTVAATDSATVFTNEGAAGAVTFTLPTAAEGLFYEFLVVADQTVTISGPADTLVIDNDAGADSVSFATATEKIGNKVRAIATDGGSKWFIEVIRASDSVSVTTAT